jgi:hypothetical protein
MTLLRGFTAHLKRPPEDMGATIMTLPSLRPRRLRAMAGTSAESAGYSSSILKKNRFKVRVASTHGIYRDAGMLIRERYAQRGYGAHELAEDPNRWTIVAFDDGEPMGTLSIRFDSSAGLLCDDLYLSEINELRATRRKVCEFIKFAAVSSTASLKILAALFHVAFVFAHKIHGCDDVVIEVNPHHVNFYKRALGFSQIGCERMNRRVNAPAVLLHGDFSYIGEQIRKYGAGNATGRAEKSLYPYAFNAHEEQSIQQRLAIMGA